MKGKLKYKKIKDLNQYNEYCDMHEQLLLKEEASKIDEIELLELLIEDFDNRMNKGMQKDLNPVELLRSILSDAGMSQSQFAREVDISRQLVSDILGYRRNISKELVVKFSECFAMSQEAFSRSYDLKKANYLKQEKTLLVKEKRVGYKKKGSGNK